MKAIILILLIALSSCAPNMLTCADYAAGKGRGNNARANTFKKQRTRQTNFVRANPIPKI